MDNIEICSWQTWQTQIQHLNSSCSAEKVVKLCISPRSWTQPDCFPRSKHAIRAAHKMITFGNSVLFNLLATASFSWIVTCKAYCLWFDETLKTKALTPMIRSSVLSHSVKTVLHCMFDVWLSIFDIYFPMCLNKKRLDTLKSKLINKHKTEICIT